jgi:hypothetical protein
LLVRPLITCDIIGHLDDAVNLLHVYCCTPNPLCVMRCALCVMGNVSVCLVSAAVSIKRCVSTALAFFPGHT